MQQSSHVPMGAPTPRPLCSVKLRAIRCFAEAEVELDPRVTVIIGENGSGKTTLAESISSLCYGDDEGLKVFPIRQGAESGFIELRDAAEASPIASWQYGSTMEERNRLADERLLFAYGRYRRVHFPEPPIQTGRGDFQLLTISWPEADSQLANGRRDRTMLTPPEIEAYSRQPVRGSDILAQSNRYRTTTLTRPDNHLLRDVGDYLRVLYEQRGVPVFDIISQRLERWLIDLQEGIQGLEFEMKAHGVVPIIRRHGIPLELRQLSDGYQALLVVVFDLIFRLLRFYPLLDDPFQGFATVIIDEVDLHLHPRWQRTVVDQLASLFPRVQFILTTHSAAVVQSAIDRRHRIVVLHERDDATVAAISNVDKLQGAEISSVLVHPALFAVPSRYSPRFERLERKARQLRKKINQDKATAQDREKLLQVLDTLQQLHVAEEARLSSGSSFSEIAKTQIAMLKSLNAKLGNK